MERCRFPGMVFLVLSRDADFGADVHALLRARSCQAQVSTSQREAESIAAYADVEMVV